MYIKSFEERKDSKGKDTFVECLDRGGRGGMGERVGRLVLV
jgi:hypothetical protein